MCAGYIAAGLPPGRFWRITPRLYLIEMKGAAARLEREHNDRAWAAHLTAYLPSQKKFVPLKDIQVGARAVPAERPWQEKLAAWEAFAKRGQTA